MIIHIHLFAYSSHSSSPTTIRHTCLTIASALASTFASSPIPRFGTDSKTVLSIISASGARWIRYCIPQHKSLIRQMPSSKARKEATHPTSKLPPPSPPRSHAPQSLFSAIEQRQDRLQPLTRGGCIEIPR